MSLFIRINNKNNFLLKEIPSLHPDSMTYLDYWKEQRRRCIEGFWGVDDENENVDISDNKWKSKIKSNKWRFIPPTLYFYVNFGTILGKEEDAPKSAPQRKMRPFLRDIEWEFHYNWLEARGFSGFSNDKKYTCLRDVLDWKLGKLTKASIHKSAFNEDGTLKEYISARIYLRQLHNKELSKPLYYNEPKNLFWLSSRGGGKSLNSASIDAHELLFDGLKEYKPMNQVDEVVSIIVGASIGDKSSETIEKIVTIFDNLPGGWRLGTPEAKPSPFAKIMVGSTKPNNGDSPWRNEIVVTEGGIDKTYGTGCKLKHVIFTVNNPQAAVGGRNTIIDVDEVGLVPNLLDVHGSNESNQYIDHYIGSSLYTGTGGNVEKIIEAEKIFRNPGDYRMLEFDDTFEGMGKIGWFVPATHTNNRFKDKNGNTNEEEALAYYTQRREEKKKAIDSKALDYELMNYPLIPSEMFLSSKANKFPLNTLRLRKSELMSSELLNGLGMTGFFEELDGKIVWNPTRDVKPIREFPLSYNTDSTGCVEMWEPPRKDNMDEVIADRYIGALDPVDDDEENTRGTKRSLQSFWIYDLWTDKLVLEYTGRTDFKDDFYEQCLYALRFYKATVLYENQKKGFFTFMDIAGYLYLLEDNPKQLQDTESLGIGRVKNTKKGVYLTGYLKQFGLNELNEYLRTIAYGEEDKINASKIKSLGLVLELLAYGPGVNVDRISSLIILMIYKKLKAKTIIDMSSKKSKEYVVDPFVGRNFGNYNYEDN